jgi:hypothetical protein
MTRESLWDENDAAVGEAAVAFGNDAHSWLEDGGTIDMEDFSYTAIECLNTFLILFI